ncbi:MAG: glycoside hydrolase family 43 protein [Chloroflexi bacterium]|nr:glycoside hydrolase family 43 protein [Chloroflexota bacterium]
MDRIKIGSRREVCWDEYLIDQAQDVRVQMHHPEFRNVVLDCNAPWEGNRCGYFVLLNDQGQFRLYYRGLNYDIDQDAKPIKHFPATMCYAESSDGKSFQRVPVRKIPFWGTTDNNILLNTIRDNMFFFKDTNPDCASEALYKGLAEDKQALWLYESADGVNFEKKRMLINDGAYDSMNVAFWDAISEQYFLFYRGIHGAGTEGGKWTAQQGSARHTSSVRDVRVRTSKDFVTWSEPQMIRFDPARDDLELYTNQVQPYYRAKHMFIGFPTRYTDRYKDTQNFAYLPDKEHRGRLIRAEGRTGTAMTDAAVMTSRDGLYFRRTEEAFLTPGIERDWNWYYGDCYFAYGMAETDGDRPGSPREISMYAGGDYGVNSVKLCRYAIRLDGFFSWRCDYQPGTVVTKPLIFDGGILSINFATSALGYIRIRLLSEDGTPIDGFDSGRLFGDSVDRPVDFQGDLAILAEKPVRMEITMSDADLYSFRFTPKVNLC